MSEYTSAEPPEQRTSAARVTHPTTPSPEAHAEGIARLFTRRGDFTDHKGFEHTFDLGKDANGVNLVNSSSSVVASICELGVFGSQVLPFMGLASMTVDNVVPNSNGTVTVRGSIGWESDLNCRLHFLVQ